MQISEQDMREAIGFELADILHRQKTILACNEALNLMDDGAHTELRTMAEEDDKNLRMLETVIGSYGIRVEPRYAAVQIADVVNDIVTNEASIPIEKLGAYILLKQNQMMCSHLVHKSVQATDPDIKVALIAFDGVYATFTRHVTELTKLMETAGVEWITGKEPVTGIFGRARDAVSTLAGMVMSKVAKPADEMSVLPILTMDHRKVDVLFKEITENNDPQKDAGLFHQLKADLTSHSIAEEETVYSRFQNLPDMKQLMIDARQEHEDIRTLLDEITDVMDDRESFLDKIDDLQQLVKHHVDEEENQAFPLIKKNSSEEVLMQMSQEFMEAKKRIQENVGVDEIIASAANEDSSEIAASQGGA
ncbi:MAG TPA: hemerythrin domain-containing protein [Oligoflexus sp.]|uniref:hemerythrin domain-containing protein n=1 Tax=Oligoflexus sp. TaxID=1971216 RepID=UPI002D499CB3|nr:hemerythrin domain-containing protein [Oligoflexus sp.]HYX34040.1 hemerythrin domain-containing protein [Oligoflexus sp.]